MQRNFEKLKDGVKIKESYIRQLEDDLALVNKNTNKNDNTREFNTFGNLKVKEEVNIIDNIDNDDCEKSLYDCYERRVRDLEMQVEEYRSKEQERINGLLNINSLKGREIQEQIYEHDENFAKAAIDTISILAYELCELEIKECSKRYNTLQTSQIDHSLLASQSHRSFNQNNLEAYNNSQNNFSVEKCQRVVLRYLSKTLSRLLVNNQDLLKNID